ncbi:recombination protein RecR [bacterium]|nr:recombination protein RecR [bacterium]NBX98652.1 recombination protein RecR [bacterium]NDC94089.1 recombination protein RecR [bacterium]NDD83535.1 recombination protein RecR [bacterium]NDG29336.1 recombination protein RecR [bacterium]
MSLIPKALQNVVDALSKLPGVGPRSAERFAYFLLRSDPRLTTTLATSLGDLHAGVKHCPYTFALISANEDTSSLYANPERDKTIVAVVADPFDVIAIEKTGQFSGTYHVLGGLLSPIDGIQVEDLHMNELVERVARDHVIELIIATNASVEGEATSLYLQQLFTDKNVNLTRLARGLSVGVDLEFADHISLSRALEGRQKI